MSNESRPRPRVRKPTERSEVAPAYADGVAPGREGGAPCEPCYTHGGNSSALLRHGIDSLYLTVHGQLREEAALRLEDSRRAAQSPDDSGLSQARITIQKNEFRAAPSGGKLFRYCLDDHRYRIQLKRYGAKRLPLASVQIRSWQLLTVGVREAVAELERILAELGVVELPLHVSRLDLCADFAIAGGVQYYPPEAWVTRARDVVPYFKSLKFTGWSIGRRAMAARLYDKTFEIVESGKDYMRSLWVDAGWDQVSPVWRLEFQFRREVLVELSARVYPHLLERLGGLWRYASEDWLRLTVPSAADETRCRWPTHPLWGQLQAVDWGDQARVRRTSKCPSGAPSDERLYGYFMSVLSTYMAATGMTDAGEAWDRLFVEGRAHLEGLAEVRNAGFDDQVRQRAARKALEYGLDFDGARARAQARQNEAVATAYRRRKSRDLQPAAGEAT